MQDTEVAVHWGQWNPFLAWILNRKGLFLSKPQNQDPSAGCAIVKPLQGTEPGDQTSERGDCGAHLEIWKSTTGREGIHAAVMSTVSLVVLGEGV
jgi:hypothetical protein